MTARTTDDPTTDDPTCGATTDGVCCGGATEWLPREDAERLAVTRAAVADPVRLQVLSIIANAPSGELCACDFVGPLGKSQPTVSHHLKVLSQAGLIDGDERGRWVWYRLTPGRLDGLTAELRSAAGAAR
jgi:ArsR family transcriptional regulator